MKAIRTLFSLGAFWLVLGIFAWSFSLAAARTVMLPSDMQRVSYRDAASTTPFSSVKDLRTAMVEDQESPLGHVTAWTYTSARASLKDLAANASLDVVYFDGDASDVWNLTLLRGGYPDSTDREGVTLDEKTALSLFGSIEVEGLPLTLGDSDRIVRGVVRLPSGLPTWGNDNGHGLAFVSASSLADSSSDSTPVTAWEFSVAKNASMRATEQTRTWLQSASIPTPALVNDRAMEESLMAQAAALPGWILALLCIFELVRGAWSTSALAIRRARLALQDKIEDDRVALRIGAGVTLSLLVFAGLAFAILRFANFDIRVPPEYLPTKWSDLGFWSDLIEDLLTQHATLATVPQLRPDGPIRALHLWGVLCSLLSILCFFALRQCSKRRVLPGRFPSESLIVWLLAVLAPLAANLLALRLGLTPQYQIALIVFPLLFCILNEFFRAHPPARRIVRASSRPLPLPMPKLRRRLPPASTAYLAPAYGGPAIPLAAGGDITEYDTEIRVNPGPDADPDHGSDYDTDSGEYFEQESCDIDPYEYDHNGQFEFNHEMDPIRSEDNEHEIPGENAYIIDDIPNDTIRNIDSTDPKTESDQEDGSSYKLKRPSNPSTPDKPKKPNQ